MYLGYLGIVAQLLLDGFGRFVPLVWIGTLPVHIFTFGFMGLIPTGEVEAHPWFAALGPEPLGNGFSGAHLAEAFAGKTQNIKVSLLDQRIVAGLGNIYVCEALYRARLSPLTPAGKVSRPRLETLAAVIRDVLNDAIAAGGSTLKTLR